jgi:hypothetical protein
MFNGKFYACLANEGLYRFNGKPHPGDTFTLDIDFTTGTGTGGSGDCDFSVSPDGNTIYIADGRNWLAWADPPINMKTNGGIQVYTNNGSGGYPIARVLKPDPNSTVGALYMTVDYSQANPVVYATTIGTNENKLVKIVDDLSNSGAGTATVLATAGFNQEFRGVRFGPSTEVAVAAVTITGITATEITYTGGTGSQFVLMATNALVGPIMSRDGWQRVATNTVTPSSFSISGTGNASFYYIKSE